MRTRLLSVISVASIAFSPAFANDTVQVFVLARQSNMEGHGKVNAERHGDGSNASSRRRLGSGLVL